jgi:hypothetical protein
MAVLACDQVPLQTSAQVPVASTHAEDAQSKSEEQGAPAAPSGAHVPPSHVAPAAQSSSDAQGPPACSRAWHVPS